MANRPALIRQADLERIMRAAKNAGLKDARFEISADRVIVTEESGTVAARGNSFDEIFR